MENIGEPEVLESCSEDERDFFGKDNSHSGESEDNQPSCQVKIKLKQEGFRL